MSAPALAPSPASAPAVGGGAGEGGGGDGAQTFDYRSPWGRLRVAARPQQQAAGD